MCELSDDEGPIEVTFDDSKAFALKSVKDARDSVRRGKDWLKEKRRKKQLLFQEQKKNRLLPETLLEEFETFAQRLPTLPDDKSEQQEVKKIQVKKLKNVSKSLQGNCKVMQVKDESANTSMQKTAMDFIQTRLYGPGNPRTSSKEKQQAKRIHAELLSLEKKRGLNQGAAVQFVDKQWGADQKAKAEKCNKRFIHRQKLISS
ncbi:Nucleolar protein 7 [Bagarius yarrelli]|uniref:Nucleolar protein 7 n=1 Tax=Bagarius yarrelli TaxID=175774 RepID=A0A556TV75_BAGYA|nr:Nucleolar protein 7 [Bagarius yarrelli]